MRTSITDPLEVSYLPARVLNVPGKLGMTFAPGKKGKSYYGLPWDRDLALDIADLRDKYGCQHLVCLLEEHEFAELRISDLRLAVEAAGIAFMHCPIQDVHIPSDLPCFHNWIEALVQMLRAGENVIIHCRGGRGRTGLMAACVLIYLGTPARQAVREVRTARAGTIETGRQENFVERVYPQYLLSTLDATDP